MKVRVLIEMDDGGVGIRAVNVLDSAMRAYNEKLSRAVPDAAIDFEVLGVVPDAEVRAGVLAEEPEWEYGRRGDFGDGQVRVVLASQMAALGGVHRGEPMKRRAAIPAGPWVPVKQEGAEG